MLSDMYSQLIPGKRILMGPGPSDVPDRVLRALATPLVGHLDPEFLELMDRIQQMLRRLFQTENKMTLPMSGTGSAGMETCFVNLLEPGDAAVIGINGVFGTRMAEVAERCGAEVTRVEAPWGSIVPEDEMAETLRRVRPKVAGLVHAETSTGVWQPVETIAAAAREAGTLLVLDCVTSLGGCPVELDRWGIDVAYSGTQKCLSCPPGLAPVTFGSRARGDRRAQEQGAELVPRREPAGQLLGRRPGLPPHRADLDELRAVRGARHGVRGRARAAVRAAPAQPRGAGRRHRGPRAVAFGPGRAPALDAQRDRRIGRRSACTASRSGPGWDRSRDGSGGSA